MINIINYLKVDIWRIQLEKLPKTKSFFLRQLRILLLALRGFFEDKCQLRASALTFYTLLSIVPVAAMAFGVAKGFGFEKLLEKQILEKFSEQQEVITSVIAFANTLLENTKGGLIAGIGVAVLFWTVIKVLGNIESSFNDIWGIKTSRTLGRKFSDYLSIMLICPILLISSGSITVFITTQINNILDKVALLGFFSQVIFALLKFLPYCISWVLFTFIYIFMPNTKVNFKAGLMGGIVAGTVYEIVQFFYINFQVGVAKYNAIYGSFAALPLFLFWLQLSWLIVLLGAEIAFASQNVHTYEFEPDCGKVSHSFRKMVSILITRLIVVTFSKEEKPLSDSEISEKLDMPIRLVRQIIFDLEKTGIIAEAQDVENGKVFQPAVDTNLITVKYVIEKIEKFGINELPMSDTKDLEKVLSVVEKINDCAKNSDYNVLLKDI